MTDADRIFSLVTVDDETGCWVWHGKCDNGYGRCKVGGRMVQAHRWVYAHLVGEIPAGLQLDHLCRNRACCNPEHLEPVTNRVNSLRSTGASARNAVKTHCDNGHAFDDTNTASDRGARVCLICRRERQLAYWHRTKGRNAPPRNSGPGCPGSAAASSYRD